MALLVDSPYGSKGALKGSCVAIGVFDGCHLGHRGLIQSCIDEARKSDKKSVVVTFDIDPDELFVEDPKKIMTNDERISCLVAMGATSVLLIKFDRDTAALDPIEFLNQLFAGNIPASIHVGSDFRFGKDQQGDIEMLSKWCEGHHVELRVYGLIEKDGSPVKSTRIRDLLQAGNLDEANSLLGHPYTVCGKVRHGRGEGASFGFATANVAAKCLLEDGVYAGYAEIDGCRYKAAISVGIPPTFEDESKDALEVHVLDYDGDLYGKELCVTFIERLRPMIKFDSIEELIKQVESDIAYIKKNV